MEFYAVRFYLHFSVDEWLALPWWQRRLYLEQLDKHHPWDPEAKQPAQKGEALDPMGDLESFGTLGMSVQQV